MTDNDKDKDKDKDKKEPVEKPVEPQDWGSMKSQVPRRKSQDD